VTDTSPRDLADRFQQRWLEHNPFAATMYGIPGYDHLLPDESEAGEQAWRAEVGRFLEEADAITAATPTEAVTLGCVREAGAHEQDGIDMASAEHTVTAMQFAGPATFLAVAARTVLVDPEAAEAYLTRLRGSGTWFDQLRERPQTGARKGRLPVAPLAGEAIGWAEDTLPGLAPVFAPQPPPGWDRVEAWEQERRAVADEVVRPGLARWVETVRELLPRARPSEQAGLTWLPGGQEDYARAIRIFTTLPRSAEELHQTGLDQVAELEARAVRLGAGLGLSGRDEVFGALRDSAGQISAEEAHRIGIVNRVVGAEEFDGAVREWAEKLAKKAPVMMKLGKDAMFRQLDMPFAEALDFLRSQLTIAMSTEDIVEGVSAFFEKREPQWKGR